MNVQIYADGQTVYDSRIPWDPRKGPTSVPISEALNKGGTASMTLMPGHPLYDAFVPLKTEITIYRNGKLRWRGRSLIPEDDLYCRRTIPCEGELCFFNDAIQRPYSFSCAASEAFAAVVSGYNAAVEPWKRFSVGEITVDADVKLESNKAEKAYETLRKLVQKYGGYLILDTAEDGSRRINWLAALPYTCNQPIKFGRNLLDYSTESSVTGFVTRLIPYGAEDEDGNRLTLNIDGKDYVENEDAIAICGIVEDSAYYDDVESADLLAVRAKLDLLKAASMPRTLKMSALDLSRQDMTMESFAMGQRIPAESGPHGISGEYDLAALEEDLLDPGSGSVSLTRSADYYRSGTLTGNLSQAAKDDAEAARLEALAQTLARRDQIKKAMEEAAAQAQEMADQAEKNANDYADDAASAAGDAAVEESKSYTDVEVKKTSTSLSTKIETNAGDISTLKQTATSMQSQITNAENDRSTIKQTVGKIETRVSTAEGDITKIQQTATYNEQKVQNNEGDISDLKQTASELEAKVKDNEGNIADLSLRAEEFEVKLSDAEGDISDLSQKVDSITIKVSNGSTKSTISIWANGVQLASQEITLSGLVSFAALKGSGTTEINGSNIVTGIIEALKVALRGEFQIFSGETLSGYLGHIEGSTGDEITTGVGMRSSDNSIYVAVTTGGSIMRAGSASIFVTKNGHATVNGDLYVKGSVIQNADI